MEIRYWGRRAVSLVLALELLLSPVAMARVADPSWLEETPEIPMGEEVMDQRPADTATSNQRPDDTAYQAATQEGEALPFDRVLITSNLSTLMDTISGDYDEELGQYINSYFFRLNSADRLLNVEMASDETARDTLWIQTDPYMRSPAKDVGQKSGEDSRYTYLPATGEARVPDMKYDGYALATVDAQDVADQFFRLLGQEGGEEVLPSVPDGVLWPSGWPADEWATPDYDSYAATSRLFKLQGAYPTVVRAQDEYSSNYLPLAAWFSPSDQAKLTALAITAHGTTVEKTILTKVYTQDPLAEESPTDADLTDFAAHPEGNKEGTEFAAREMWLQVGSDQTSLDLHFQTYEPYYSFTKDGGPQEGEDVLCPVSVTYSLDGGANLPLALDREAEGNLTCQFLPRPQPFETYGNRGTNTPEDKARGDWQITGIPLTAGEGSDPGTVDITLTVTAPDGQTQQSYVIHVQRRQNTTGKSVLEYGNTPYGMIARDNANDKWNDTVTKELARTRFLANNMRFSDVATRPTGPVNQNGGIYHRYAYYNCWSGEGNPDLVDTAIVAYQDMSFRDPGVTFTDSFGRTVDLNKALYQGTVKRTVQLKTPKSGVLSADSWALADALTDTCWYNVIDGKPTLTTDMDQASQVLTFLDQEVDLRGLMVLPGVYQVVYHYVDPCGDQTTPATGAKPSYTDTVTRTLVVLPIPGDVDMDGAVTTADAYALRSNLESWQNSTSSRVALGIGRVFDVDGNGALEEADYRKILTGFQPELLRSGPVSDYFYLPLSAGNTGYQRRSWNQVTNTGSGKLSLEFLGVEKGKRNGEFTVTPGGPFDTKKEADNSLTPVALVDQETGVDNSIFWMGVKLTDSPLNGEQIENFSLSLIYDNRYVEPAQVYTASDKSSYETEAGSGSFEGWSYTLRKYNLRATDDTNDQIIWKGKLSAYDAAGSTAQRSYQTHYSKVVGTMEQERGTSDLREMTVTLRYQSNGTVSQAKVGNGYLLVVPFRLKSQPPKSMSSNARLIELGAGMRELTLVTTPAQNLLASLFNVGRAAGEEQTSAFSAQDAIYGGSTKNLRDGLRYDTASGTVPIGEDNTARTVLRSATYGEEYRETGVGSTTAVGVIDDFPPGLTFNAGYQSITGTPLLPGVYQFEISGMLYELTVQPKTIHYRPREASSYYGEQEYRGNPDDRAGVRGQRNFTFEYNAKDLAPADRDYARDELGLDLGNGTRDEWRDGSELAEILNRTVENPYNEMGTYNYLYTAPQFTATLDTAGNPVEVGTSVGGYTINTTQLTTPTCYTMEQVSTGTLVILPRPVYVDHIIASVEDAGLSIYNDEPVRVTGRTLYDKGATTQIALTLPLLENGLYYGLPLTGSARVGSDRIAVSYSGRFLHDLSKGDTNTSFQLSNRREERQIEAETVSLLSRVQIDGVTTLFASGNYTLAGTSVRHQVAQDDIKGIVILRGVSELAMTQFPAELSREVNYYGARIETPTALKVRAVLGEGSGSTQVGQYDYNSPDLFPLLIHYNWVTPEEYEAGTAPGEETSLVGTGVNMATGQDTRPYGFSREVDPTNRREGGYRDNYLFPDMDGWRICACVTKYVGDQEAGQDVQYIKCYSQPITVKARPLTLTVKSARRYYGEDLNASQKDFTFQPAQLAGRDTPGVTRGTSQELKMVFDRLDTELAGYGITERHQLPGYSILDDQGNEVTATTPITTGRTYQIVLSGASSPCYEIRYTVQGGEEPTTSETAGSAPLEIQPRPIIVKTIRGDGEGGSFTSIYADTKNLVVTQDTVTKADFVAVRDKVDFMLPQFDPVRGTTSYYTATSDGNMYTDYGCTFPAGTTNALVSKEGVVDDVQVRYQIRFLPDEGCYTWSEFTQGFFDNDAIAESATGYLDKNVQVEKMELVGADAGNYVMVFADDVSFQDKVPSDAMSHITSAPANNNEAMNKSYYVSGTGRVYLRPIQNIVITSLGQMTYTYGDQFAPGEPGSSGSAMTVRVEYAQDYDNDPAQNVHAEEVVYRQLRVDETGQRISTFAARSFTIYYVKPGQTDAEAEMANQTLTNGDVVEPSIHNGATLFVTGKRSTNDQLVYSHYATADLEAEEIRVGKAALTLTAVNAHKFYGEDNPTSYTFTFNPRQLTQVDRNRLMAHKGWSTLPTEASADDLRWLDEDADFSGLNFSTNARQNSPVGLNGRWGEYDLTLTAASATGMLTNYDVVTQGAHLYVYPRPVAVTGINSTQAEPVYTIFNDPQSYTYNTELSTKNRVNVTCGTNGATRYPVTTPDGRVQDLPITPSLGLVGSDELLFRAQVDYPRKDGFPGWSIPTDTAEISLGVRVSNLKLVDTTTTRNYTLLTASTEGFGDMTTTPGAGSVWGAVKLRTIKSINIMNPPIKTEYTYGEPLDLTGLQVQIEYDQLDAEGQVERVTVDYLGPEQFKSMGLYVNYWTPGDTLPEDNALRRSLPKDYWTAATGDHVTIAPTHDTQQYLTSPVSNPGPKEQPFTANGKYLVISAFQEAVSAETQIAAVPKILGQAITGGYYEGTPIPIKVNPLKLRYTLTAEDKTYDGDTKAAGALTLTNVYGSGPDTADVVYVPMGAGYENSSMDHNRPVFNTFKEKVSNGQVTFSTGTYTPNGEAPLAENGKTIWADRYTWGNGLTFTFPNANVHYVDGKGVTGVGDQDSADYWRTSQSYEDVTSSWDKYKAVTAMPVEVTNMALAGPDAANYTWEWDETWAWDVNNSHQVTETEVLMTTRATAVDGQAATPFATIQKANRATIPTLTGWSGAYAQLAVDRTTNVVRLLLDQDLSALADNNNAAGTADEFRAELHYEYGLLYVQLGADGSPTGLLGQWAGPEGEKAYQDTAFFGGETVAPNATASGYQPDLNRLPKGSGSNENTVYKGQDYQWAALDTGVVTVAGRTFREDSGYAIDPTLYPGGAILTDKDGNQVPAEEAYWYYKLYKTDRTSLPRDTVFYPVIRLAETHNYNASGSLSGDDTVTAELLDTLQKALSAWEADHSNTVLADAARSASQAVLDKLTAEGGMEDAAQAAAQAQIDFDAEAGEKGQWPQDAPAPQVGPAAAIKTLKQRFDLTSASRERSQDTTDDTEYLVEILEAVWFTDTLLYDDEKLLSAVVFNHPTRYYGFYWDADLSAKVSFDETTLDFTEELHIPVEVKLENGSTLETTIIVNRLDETVGGRSAKIYVQTSGGETGSKVRVIQIIPTALYARLGDPPYQLTVVTVPEKPSNRRYRWASSDPAVATVDENGLVTIRDEGECLITVTTDNGKSSSISVIVSQVLPLPEEAGTLFNFYRAGAWMELDEDGNFYPTKPMTRAQAVELLDLFLNPTAQWTATTELPYLDVTGKEKYADALRRLTGAGIVTGLPGSSFEGERLITRAEFMTMVTRMLQLDTPDTRGQFHVFQDAGEKDTWAYRYIDALGKTGVTKGTGNGNFSPNRVMTREEAAVILARLLVVQLDMDQTDLDRPADMTPENWSYLQVVRAINTVQFPEPAVTPPAETD